MNLPAVLIRFPGMSCSKYSLSSDTRESLFFFATHIISDIEKCADDIIYISGGKIVSAMPREEFIKQYSQTGENLEDTILRMEGGAFHA